MNSIPCWRELVARAYQKKELVLIDKSTNQKNDKYKYPKLQQVLRQY